jgi:hypothetical protein
MAHIEFVSPATEHVAELARTMRQADRDEIAACGVPDPAEAIQVSLDRATWAYCALVDGEVAAIFGIAPYGSLVGDLGVPWLLGSDLLPRHRKAFLRLAPHYVELMRMVHPKLLNIVDSRNAMAVRWLRHAGFTVHPANYVAPTGVLFHVFEMGA